MGYMDTTTTVLERLRDRNNWVIFEDNPDRKELSEALLEIMAYVGIAPPEEVYILLMSLLDATYMAGYDHMGRQVKRASVLASFTVAEDNQLETERRE